MPFDNIKIRKFARVFAVTAGLAGAAIFALGVPAHAYTMQLGDFSIQIDNCNIRLRQARACVARQPC